jgi:hypothetical protein
MPRLRRLADDKQNQKQICRNRRGDLVCNETTIMKTKSILRFAGLFCGLAMGAGLLAATFDSSAQDMRFFRIAGPAPTAIIAFQSDGTLVWSNALAGTNYTVQTATALGGGTNWVDYVQLPVTNGVNTNRIIDPNPPAGMALIPAGQFHDGG